MELKKLILINDDIFNKHKAKELGSLTYGEVGQIKRNVSKESIESVYEIFRLIYKVNRKEFFDADVIMYFYALKYVEKQIIDLVEKEKKVLYSNPDPEMEIAGSKRLSIFGEGATTINLGRSFSMDPHDIENWSYNYVFFVLAYDKIHGEVQKNYADLKKK